MKHLPKIFILILLFLFSRLILILFGSSDFFSISELIRGTMAHEMMHNQKWPWTMYHTEAHTGGSFVSAILIIPFFFILGENLVAIKITALIISLGIMLCVYFFVDRCLNQPKVALWALLWFIFSPPLYFINSTILMGEHYDTQLFTFIAFILFCNMLDEGRDENGRLKYAVFFGLICGFSTYFSYTFLITLASCFFCWFFINRRFFISRLFFVSTICFFIGFLPRVIYNYQVGLTTLLVRDLPIYKHINLQPQLFFERIKYLVVFYWPHGFWEGELGNLSEVPFLGVFLVGVFIISYFIVVFDQREIFYPRINLIKNKAMLLVLLYPLLFILIHVINDFTDELRSNPAWTYNNLDDYTAFKYVLPLMPFVFIIMGAAINSKNFLKKSHFRNISLIYVALFSFFWITSISQTRKFLSFDNYEKHISRWKPLSYQDIGDQVSRVAANNNLIKRIGYIRKIEAPYQNPAFRGLGYALASDYYMQPLPNDVFLLVPHESKNDFVKGLGLLCGEALLDNTGAEFLEDVCPTIYAIPWEFELAYMEGVGVGVGARWDGIHEKVINLISLEKDYLPMYYRGFVVGRLRRYRGDIEKMYYEFYQVPGQYQKDFIIGLTKWYDYFYDFEIDNRRLNNLIKILKNKTAPL